MDLNVLHNPFIDMLGAQLVEWYPEHCTWELEIAAHHTNTQGTLHGGVMATVLDVACGCFRRHQVSDTEAQLPIA